jgi:hypothetical protein
VLAAPGPAQLEELSILAASHHSAYNIPPSGMQQDIHPQPDVLLLDRDLSISTASHHLPYNIPPRCMQGQPDVPGQPDVQVSDMESLQPPPSFGPTLVQHSLPPHASYKPVYL